MVKKESLFAGLHILMRAIPDGPADAGRRLHRYWYRESRCQVRTGWQKTLCSLWLYLLILAYFPSRSVKICVNPWLMNYLCAYKAPFCASLRLTITVFTRPKTSTISVNPVILSNIFRVLRVLRGEKNREISVNPWLINDLRSTKDYVRKNNLFMQNKAKFRKVKFNVTKVLTKDYDQMDTWSIRKNEPKRTQTNPISEPKLHRLRYLVP
jgi:hypothetical protein